MTKTRERLELMHEVEALARGLMARWLDDRGIAGWGFKWNTRAKRMLGACEYATKTIELNLRYALLADRSSVVDTILHEIAHVIAGSRGHFGHGRGWKAACRLVGARPLRCSKGFTELPPELWVDRWRGQCPCGKVFYACRVRPGYENRICRACQGRFRFIDTRTTKQEVA